MEHLGTVSVLGFNGKTVDPLPRTVEALWGNPSPNPKRRWP